jgi:hypothetical protein
MFSRFAIALLGSALSFATTAQELPVLAMGAPGFQEAALVEQLLALDGPTAQSWTASAPVVPIWSGTDGHLLAIVAVPGEWGSPLLAGTTAQPGPASWYLLDGTTSGSMTSASSGLRWQMDNGFHADALFSQHQRVLPAFCGLVCDTNANTIQGGMTGSLGLGWMSPDGGMDLSYGLSWLQTRDGPALLQALPSAGTNVPVLTLPGALSYGLQSQTALFARGRWRLNEDTAFDVGASYGHGSSMPLGSIGTALPGIDLDQLSLSLGLDAGSLRGAIVGHVLRSDDPSLIGKKWTALDLGVSWRTPWRAEISVGAQNLWSTPLDVPRDADPAQARTPYIQYRQDL